MCGQSDESPTTHHELSSTAIQNSELAVLHTLDAFNGYLNPFDMDDKSQLFVLSSGARVPKDVMKDVLRVEDVGKMEKKKFTKERLTKDGDDIKDFFDRLPRVKLLSMDCCNKTVRMSNSQGQVIKYKEQGDTAFRLLVMAQELAQPISIDELMTFNITAVSHSLGTPDGFMTKRQIKAC